jgi:hypothetical protein
VRHLYIYIYIYIYIYMYIYGGWGIHIYIQTHICEGVNDGMSWPPEYRDTVGNTDVERGETFLICFRNFLSFFARER